MTPRTYLRGKIHMNTWTHLQCRIPTSTWALDHHSRIYECFPHCGLQLLMDQISPSFVRVKGSHILNSSWEVVPSSVFRDHRSCSLLKSNIGTPGELPSSHVLDRWCMVVGIWENKTLKLLKLFNDCRICELNESLTCKHPSYKVFRLIRYFALVHFLGSSFLLIFLSFWWLLDRGKKSIR